MVQGFGAIAWLGAAVSVAVGGYMTTTYGAAERAHLHAMENQIIDAKKDIRGLETEFSARASMVQLQQWSTGGQPGEQVAYGAPDADRYLNSETQLASLNGEGDAAKLQTAVAMNTPGVQTAQVQPVAQTASVQPAVRHNGAVQSAPAVVAAVAQVDKQRPALANAGASPSRVTRVASRNAVAMLSPGTLQDLDRGAVSERRAMR